MLAVVVAGLAVVASTLLPWATYENLVGTTTEFGSGSGGFLLAALAVASACCALMGWARRSAILHRAGIASAAACLVCAVALWFAAIVSANDASGAGGRTTHVSGAFVGLLGSLGLLISCSVLRRSVPDVQPQGATTT